ncbi:dopamine receptor d5 [Plakobranchus ocellatus]|uniref:Dopamine receptor d5 n=1 Tax=Plakobranchus ocellatus TaxID=259542 RepID=A0AAV4CAE1_9GAST|nr:dopamine receptor d5 [Plakobranchus ocellatus]
MSDGGTSGSSPERPPADDANDDGYEVNVGETVGAMALSAWAVLTNLFLIVAILRSEHRRKVSFNLHVCNLCLVGLLLAGLVLPLYIDFCLHGHWRHGDQLCRIWLMADMVVGVASVLVVFSAVFDRFVHFSCPGSVEGGCKFVLSAILILLPWAVACGLVLPLYMHGETGEGVGLFHDRGDKSKHEVITYEVHKGGRSGIENGNVRIRSENGESDAGSGNDIYEDKGYCYLHLRPPHALTMELAGYAVPALAAVGLLVATSLTWCVRRQELRELDYSVEREHKGWQVITSWLVCVAVVGMWFPFSALHVLTFLVDRSWPEHWMTIAVWLAYANAGVNPLLWLVMPRLRQSVCSLLCCCFCCCACCCQCCRDKRTAYRNRHRDYIEDKEAGTAMIEFRGR